MSMLNPVHHLKDEDKYQSTKNLAMHDATINGLTISE